MREDRKVYKVLVGKLEGKRLLGRPRLRWDGAIRMDPMDIGWWAWSRFSRDRWLALENTVVILQVLAPRS
jgi:hypothetical protein